MKYARLSNNIAVEVVTDAEYATFNATVKAMFQEVPAEVDRKWRLIDGEWQAPGPEPEPEPTYQSLTKLQFVRLIKQHGGTTNEQVVAAYRDEQLAFFWLMFELATSVERDDPEISEGLAALEQLGYLPNGAQAVLDGWPMA